MAKDPAFLFYSKDWLEGTAELLPHEKGIYIDLLCYQHQRGDLPADTMRLSRLVGMNHDDFMKVWPDLQDKFEHKDGRLFNKKLHEVMSERGESSHRNRIIGIFSQLLRKNDLTKEQYKYIRSKFKAEDFQSFKDDLNERLSEWYSERYSECCTKRSKSIAIGNENAIAIEDENRKGGVGEKQDIPTPRITKKADPYFTLARDVWFDFYKNAHPANGLSPSFDAVSGAKIKAILAKLKLKTEESGQHWEEKSAEHAFRMLLTSASKMKWLRENFSLKNIDSQFDQIIQNALKNNYVTNSATATNVFAGW